MIIRSGRYFSNVVVLLRAVGFLLCDRFRACCALTLWVSIVNFF